MGLDGVTGRPQFWARIPTVAWTRQSKWWQVEVDEWLRVDGPAPMLEERWLGAEMVIGAKALLRGNEMLLGLASGPAGVGWRGPALALAVVAMGGRP